VGWLSDLLLTILKWALSGLTHKSKVKASDGVAATDDTLDGIGAHLRKRRRLLQRPAKGSLGSADSDGPGDSETE